MTLKVSTVGEQALLRDLLGVTAPAALTIKLFTNNITPSDADIASSFTEMAGLGYADKDLTTTSWAVSQQGAVAEAAYPAQVWTFIAGSPVTIYGYYVVGADNILRWAERLSAPFTAQVVNDSLTITPKFNISSGA